MTKQLACPKLLAVMASTKSRLRAIRERKGLQREVVAAAAGMTVSHLYNLEQGRNKPSLDLARRIAEALDVTVDDIFPSDTAADLVAPERA